MKYLCTLSTIFSDPFTRRKTREILNDPQDFDRISAAVSPDNLQSLKTLTIQSGHTHKVIPGQENFGSRSTLSSSRGDSYNASQHSIPQGAAAAAFEASCLDYTTDNCFAGYATIRRSAKDNEKKSTENLSSRTTVITKSMPTDVHLIGANSDLSLSRSTEEKPIVTFDDKKPPIVVAKKKIEPLFPDPPLLKSDSNKGPVKAKSSTSRSFGAVNGTNQFDNQDLTKQVLLTDNTSSGLPEKESRSLSPEIKEAIASADPSSCWADYFPENLSLNSSFANQKPSEKGSQQSLQHEKEFPVTTTPGKNDPQELPPNDIGASFSGSTEVTVNISSPESMNTTDLSTPPLHKNLNDSLTDDEISPMQQTQHFNSPVLGQTQRNLFFNQELATSVPSQNGAVHELNNEPCSDRGSNVTPGVQESFASRIDDQQACSAGSIGVRSAKGTSVRRDSFEKENLDIDEDDEESEGKCYILESLEIAAPPPPKPTPEVDLAAAKRLASRLYYLNGFGRADVPKHLGKK